jgi:hypothetical protein
MLFSASAKWALFASCSLLGSGTCRKNSTRHCSAEALRLLLPSNCESTGSSPEARNTMQLQAMLTAQSEFLSIFLYGSFSPSASYVINSTGNSSEKSFCCRRAGADTPSLDEPRALKAGVGSTTTNDRRPRNTARLDTDRRPW